MQEQPPDPLIEEALRWFVVLKDRSASEADHAAFNRWLQEDPRHAAAWKQAQRTWMRVGKIGPAFANSAPAAISLGASAVAALPPSLAATPGMRPTMSRPPRVSRRRLFYAAAAVTAMVVPTALALSRPGLFADQRTTVGERQTISLPDGSTVELAGASALSVYFTGRARRLVLHAGEAFFDAALDPERPFVVEAAAGSVRTPGAAFDVKFTDDAVTVAAVRGAVEVSATGLPPADKLPTVKSVADAAKRIEADHRTALEMVAKAGESDLATKRVAAPWDPTEMLLGEQCLMMIDAHLATHKAQLFYYLKLMGKPVHTGHLYGM